MNTIIWSGLEVKEAPHYERIQEETGESPGAPSEISNLH